MLYIAFTSHSSITIHNNFRSKLRNYVRIKLDYKNRTFLRTDFLYRNVLFLAQCVNTEGTVVVQSI